LSSVGLESLGAAGLFEHLRGLTIVNPLPLVLKDCFQEWWKKSLGFLNLESFVFIA